MLFNESIGASICVYDAGAGANEIQRWPVQIKTLVSHLRRSALPLSLISFRLYLYPDLIISLDKSSRTTFSSRSQYAHLTHQTIKNTVSYSVWCRRDTKITWNMSLNQYFALYFQTRNVSCNTSNTIENCWTNWTDLCLAWSVSLLHYTL